MNQINHYIDRIFRKYHETEEMKEFHEELKQNCAERYQEYINEGMLDDEAEEAVIQHLGDIDSILEQMEDNESYDSSIRWKDFAKNFARMMKEGANVIIENTISESENVHEDVTYAEKSKVKIETIRSDVEIYCTDTPEVKVSYYPDTTCFQTQDTGSTLSIQDQPHSKANRVVLEVNSLNDLDIKTVSGDVEVEGVSSRVISVHTASGDMDLHLGETEVVSLHSASGDIEIDTKSDKLDLEMETASGDINIDCETFDRISASTASGDIELDSKAVSFDKISMNTASGDIELSLRNISEADCHVTTLSGDVSVSKPHADGVNIIRIRTVSGDIEIE